MDNAVTFEHLQGENFTFGNFSISSMSTPSPCNSSCNLTPSNDDVIMSSLVTLKYFGYVFQPLILLLGITGNTFNVIIMNSKQFSHVTTRYFLIALSLSDTSTLITQLFNKEFMVTILGIDIRALSDIGCKVFWFVFRTSKMVSSWFVVFICIDRFIAVRFPLKAKILSRRRIALMEILSAIAVNGGLNAYWSYASKIVNGRCHPDVYDKTDPNDVELFRGLLTAGSSLCFLIPMCIMALLTPMIIYQLYKQSKTRKNMSTNTITAKRDAKISFMLIGITIAFFIFVTPGVLLHNIAFYLGVNAFGKNVASFLLYKEIAQVLEQVNYAINFFLYILTSSQFRNGLVKLVCRKQKRGKFARYNSSDGSSRAGSTRVWHSGMSDKSLSGK